MFDEIVWTKYLANMSAGASEPVGVFSLPTRSNGAQENEKPKRNPGGGKVVVQA